MTATSCPSLSSGSDFGHQHVQGTSQSEPLPGQAADGPRPPRVAEWALHGLLSVCLNYLFQLLSHYGCQVLYALLVPFPFDATPRFQCHASPTPWAERQLVSFDDTSDCPATTKPPTITRRSRVGPKSHGCSTVAACLHASSHVLFSGFSCDYFVLPPTEWQQQLRGRRPMFRWVLEPQAPPAVKLWEKPPL